MRRLIIRDHRGHATMDLDTEEAIKELERLMNEGMLAVASSTISRSAPAIHVLSSDDPILKQSAEVSLMWPLGGGGWG